MKIPYINYLITDQDKKVLKHLINFSINKFIENDNVELEFEFEDNKFIEKGIYKILYIID